MSTQIPTTTAAAPEIPPHQRENFGKAESVLKKPCGESPADRDLTAIASKTRLEPPIPEGLPIVLPPHLTENFEKADSQIKQCYGQSPGVSALLRLWVACGTSGRIRSEFERAVLDIKRKTVNPIEESEFDENCL